MYTGKLKKVAMSVMMAVPPTILEMLQMKPGSVVNMSVGSGHLIVEPGVRKSYDQDELLAQCDASIPFSEEDTTWMASPAKGEELI